MSDKLTPQQRYVCMSHNRAKDTKPEMIVRRWLWTEGYRYRLNVQGLPGKPDIVIRKLKTVIFINGCFWHGHNVKVMETGDEEFGIFELGDSECCKVPQTNREFWLKKITNNKLRDYKNYTAYQGMGWHVLIVWECMLKPKIQEAALKTLSQHLNRIAVSYSRVPEMYQFKEQDDYMMAAEPVFMWGGSNDCFQNGNYHSKEMNCSEKAICKKRKMQTEEER